MNSDTNIQITNIIHGDNSMLTFASIAQLSKTKTQLGQIEFLDFRAFDLATAHQKLGIEVQMQTQKVLTRKLAELTNDELITQIRLARQCRHTIEEKINSVHINSQIRAALMQYLACLSAWSKGVELDNFHHQCIQDVLIDGIPVTPDDLALMLQNDNTGCQTGVYREQGGAVVLWHTEEDEEELGSRFDKPRIVTFLREANEKSIELNAFIYPEVLPGPAYCWHTDGYMQAVDFLHLSPSSQDNCIFANVATWVAFFIGRKLDIETIIEDLCPFVDGYAITTVHPIDQEVIAKKIEFAGHYSTTSKLMNASGTFLFQVNLISSDSTVAMCQDINDDDRSYYEQRLVRTKRIMARTGKTEKHLAWFYRLITSRLGGDGAYANEMVKSYFLTRVTVDQAEIWIGAGPALLNEKPRVIIQSIQPL